MYRNLFCNTWIASCDCSWSASNWTLYECFPRYSRAALTFSQRLTIWQLLCSLYTLQKNTFLSWDTSFNEPHSLINFLSISCVCQCLHSSTICYHCLSICFPLSTFLSPLQRLINLYSPALSLNLLQCFPSLPLVSFLTFTSVLWCSLEETT